MASFQRVVLTAVLALSLAQPARAMEAPTAGVGTVHMPISCSSTTAAEFDRGLALLHSFWYDRALSVFDGVIAREPQCRIAFWAAAMTFNHPLWSPPTKTDITEALEYVRRGRSAATANERERGLFDAVARLYGDGDLASIPARNAAYRDAMVALDARFPDDETQLFTALAIMGAAPSSRVEHERAAAIAEAVHARQPNHPGALHYLIHAYDTDGLYDRGLPAARAYAASAPAIPHALHMPSHIFNALGYWQESADSNAAAWKASADAVLANHEDGSERDFHTLQFGQYALLQMGRYAEARAQAIVALDQYAANLARIEREHLAGDQRDELLSLDFPASGMAASYMLESGDYALLSRLPAAPSSPMVDSIVHAARAFAAAAAHDEAAMQREAAHAGLALASPPAGRGNAWYTIVVGANETLAVIARAHGDAPAAAAALNEAMAAERAATKHWQPTFLAIPAHELAGRWALRDGNAASAAAYFRSSLALYPRRPMALYGLATALHGTENAAAGHTYAQQFLEMWSRADAGRAEVTLARGM
ncbi:MAG: hypothetical protein NVSMB64_24230 [Candidatus Velthaea sp.]